MIIAITGHRPDKLGGYGNLAVEAEVKEHLKALFYALKPEYIWSGMALGVDQWAAEVAINMNIPFKAAIPFKGQEQRWPVSSRNIYHKILEKASEQVVVCEGDYAAWKMQRRNEYMVDHADLVVAVWDGSDGGTGNCVQYARQKDKVIYQINPKDFIK